MKVTHRIFSMILCVVMLVTMSLTATVSASGDGIMYDLTSLGITGGFGFEDHLDSNITRAEFAQLVVNMMNHKDIAKSMESASYFSDVANSPYKGAINLLYKEEIVSGTGAGTFDPNRNVRYTEACKMLVKALGYHVIVSDTSLDSYTFLAGTIGVTENVDTSKEYITVRDMLVMVNNCLDIDRMVPMYYNDNIAPSYVVDEGNRFRYDFEKPTPNGTVKMEGLVTGDITSYMYTERDSLKDTQLVISVDGFEKVYDFDGVAPTGFVGKRVYFYITVDADGNYGKITSLAATNKNTVASVLGTDLKSYSKNGMEFYISEKQTAKIETSIATKWLYNGAPGSYCLDTVDLAGNVQLVVIDNNDDEIFDVVSVFEYTDTIVERIDKEAKTIIFENGYYYKNEKNMYFDEDEEEITVTYFDAEGKVSNFEAIAEGDVLSIARSKSGRQLRVVISKRSGTALLEGKDGEFVTLGIEEFKVLGVNPAALKPGRNYDYKVNFMGRLVYAEEVIVTSSYAYTYKLSGATGFNTPKIQLIMPSKVESKKILDENGEDTQDESSYIRNSNLLVYNVADKVILESWVVDEDGNYSLDKKKVTANAQNLASHMDQPVSYEVDENNSIIKLSKLKPHAISVSMTYVGGEKVFAGSKSVRPFGLSENTYAMCIPTNDVTEDEILNHIQELQTNLPFEISAYEVDEDTHMVGLIVDKRAMYTESDNVLSAIIRRYFGMVTKARKVYDKETQTESIKISMYTRGTDNTMSEKTFVVSQFADNYEEFSKVNKGDLIRYGLDGFDRMIASKVVQSFESYYDGSNGYQNEDYTVCGTVTDIDYDEISNEKMGWVHVLKLENIDGPQTVELYKNEDSAPQVFILDSADRSSEMGTVEDIRYGDRILIYSNNGTIYSVVLYR